MEKSVIKQKVIRVIFWGINETILKFIKNEIDPRKAKIVAFVDSNKNRQGEVYMGITVRSPEIVDIDSAECIIVGALSAYQGIKQTLIEVGCPEAKIHPFITPHLPQYCLGDITDINERLVEKIYFESAMLRQVIAKYKLLYQEYHSIAPLVEDKHAWYQKSDLIAHACGGIVNGRHFMYTNSKEALEHSLAQHFELIECDVCGIMTGEPVLAHSYMNIYEAEEAGYTLLNLSDVLLRIKEYPKVSLLLDIKWTDYHDYESYIVFTDQEIARIAESPVQAQQMRDQIVLEVYDESTIQIANKYGYKMALTSYRNPDGHIFMNTAILCHRYHINVALVPNDFFAIDSGGMKSHGAKFLPILTDKNIKVFCFSTDSMKDYEHLKEIGVKGIFTNYLTRVNIGEIKNGALAGGDE